jgi:hypothetical protein
MRLRQGTPRRGKAGAREKTVWMWEKGRTMLPVWCVRMADRHVRKEEADAVSQDIRMSS